MIPFKKEWTPLRRMMLAQAAGGAVALEDVEVSGNPCVFSTDLARPLKRLALSLLPRQSGTGDPSPSNIRPLLPWGEVGTWTGGKNLLNIDRTEASPSPNDIFVSPRRMDTEHYYAGLQSANYYYKPYATAIVKDGTVTVETKNNNSYGVGFPVSVKGGKSYTLSATTENGLVSFGFYDDEWNYISESSAITILPTTVTTPQNASYAVVVFRSWENGGTRTYSDIQLEVGETATAYVPYTPITPHPVNVGKNLFDITQYSSKYDTMTIDGATSSIIDSRVYADNSSKIKFSQVFGVGTYTMKGNISGEGCKGLRLLCSSQITGSIWNNSYGAYWKNFGSGNEITFTLEEPSTIGLVLITGVATEPSTISNLQLEQGEQATAFQPYLPPVYGCELDLTTREGSIRPLEIETFKWGDGRSAQVIGNVERRGFIFAKKVKTTDELNADATARFCSVAPWKYNYSSADVHFYGGEWSFYVFLPVGTSDDFEFQICAERNVAPTPFTLTPQQISALVGVNTVWSDADGIELTFTRKKVRG